MTNIARTIEVISVPHGDAPASIRAAWVGCRFPTASLECGHVPQYVESVLPNKRKGLLSAAEYLTMSEPERAKLTQKIAGFNVSQAVALEVLEKRAPEAAAWWRDHGYPKDDPDRNCFRFKREEIMVVETYTEEELLKRGPMTVYDDMETGTMRPMNI